MEHSVDFLHFLRSQEIFRPHFVSPSPGMMYPLHPLSEALSDLIYN